ncbi:MAG: DsbC/DsbD-like thiol-disulfide interchange protein [Verrucomicrobiales bacterium]
MSCVFVAPVKTSVPLKTNFARIPLVLLTLASSCWAEIDTRGGQIEIGLVSEVRSIQPGKPFSIALRIAHAPEWHTYWKSPGIVGVATRLEWTLPAGFEAGEIQWPPPETVPMSSLTAWGYEREVLLMVEISPPADLEAGSKVDLNAKGAWMACARSCHPGFGDFELTLPVSDAAEPDFDPAFRDQFEAERASLPGDLDGWTAAVEKSSSTEIVLTLTPNEPTDPEKLDGVYFFSYDNQVDSDAEQHVEILPNGEIQIRLAHPDFAPENPDALAGLVFNPNGWLEADGARFARVSAAWKKD